MITVLLCVVAAPVGYGLGVVLADILRWLIHGSGRPL